MFPAITVRNLKMKATMWLASRKLFVRKSCRLVWTEQSILSKNDVKGVALNEGPNNTRKFSEIASVNLDLDCRAYHDCSDRLRCVRRRLEI